MLQNRHTVSYHKCYHENTNVQIIYLYPCCDKQLQLLAFSCPPEAL